MRVLIHGWPFVWRAASGALSRVRLFSPDFEPLFSAIQTEVQLPRLRGALRVTFVPHITLARQAVGAQPPFAPLALRRSVQRYALIRSDLRMPATYFCEQEYVATE